VRDLHMVPANAKRLRYLAVPTRVMPAPALPSTLAPLDPVAP